MSNRLVGVNGAGIRLVDTQGRAVSSNRIGANGAGIRKPSNSIAVCPTCGAPVNRLGGNGAGVRRIVGSNGAGIRRI